jgi:hypothetical protein
VWAKRSHLRGSIHAVAHADGLHRSREAFDELVEDRLVQVEAGRVDAALPGIAVLAQRRHLGDGGHVDIVEDQHRRVTAQLHHHALEALRRQRAELLADGGGAGERDAPDLGLLQQEVRDVGRNAVDQVEHALRQASIDEGAHHFHGAGRGLFCRLDDAGATGSEHRRNLADRDQCRIVPWREHRHRTDRLLDYQLTLLGKARWNDATVGSSALFGIPLQDVGQSGHFPFALYQRLSLFERHQLGDEGRPVTQQARCPPQDLGAVVGRYRGPPLVPACRRSHCSRKILAARDGQLAKHLFGGRVEHCQAIPARRTKPFTVDVQSQLRVAVAGGG